MTEESILDFPQPNPYELIQVYIEGELKKAGIKLIQINKDGTVTTDKEIPEKIKSNICQYAVDKDITIKFLTSG